MKLIVIGAGPGGYVAAIKAAMLGAEVTVIEKEKVGGTCLNVGCIPTKALIACSDVLTDIKDAKKYGIKIDGVIEPDFKLIMDRKDKVVKQLVSGIQYLFEKRGIKLINGFGKLINKNTVEVQRLDGTVEKLFADKIILSTGSIPVVPPMFKYDGKKVITSDQVLNLDKLPESMIIVGAGPIGCEIGQFFRKLGTEITIVEMLDQIVPLEDEDISKQLSRSFKMDKIKTITKDGIAKVEIKDDRIFAELASGKSLDAELMLVCVGRKPYTEGLGLEEAGILTKRGRIIVDERMETNISGIYAIGDLVMSPDLAHVASKEGTVAAENALGRNKNISYKAVPSCVFTDPEIASVGINEKKAKELGLEYKIGKFDFRGLGKAQAMGKFQGFTKILTDKEDKIIGASIIGPHATDMLGELTLAIQYGLSAEQVGDVIHPHPTLNECIMEALHDVNKECVHNVE